MNNLPITRKHFEMLNIAHFLFHHEKPELDKEVIL